MTFIPTNIKQKDWYEEYMMPEEWRGKVTNHLEVLNANMEEHNRLLRLLLEHLGVKEKK